MSYHRSQVKRRRRAARLHWIAELRPYVAYRLGLADLRDELLLVRYLDGVCR